MAVMTMCIRSFIPDCLLHWCLSGPYCLFNLLEWVTNTLTLLKGNTSGSYISNWPSFPCARCTYIGKTRGYFSTLIWWLWTLFFKWAVPGLFFFICRLFFKQLAVNKCSIKVTNDWIWTRVLRYRRQLLCQLRHRNHCPDFEHCFEASAGPTY